MNLRRKIIRKLISFQFSGWSQGSLEEQRSRQEKLSRYARLPKDINCKPLQVEYIPAEWIEAPYTSPGVILYLHGGAYTLCSINVHRELIARLAVATQMRCLAINYRLAPEHPYPAALEDVLMAYRWLLRQGVDASQIMIAGDSAGAGLALATLVSLRNAGEVLPAGAICISPWVDLTLSGDSIQQKTACDPILDPASLEMYASYYAGEKALTNPLISPLFADLRGLPPLLIQVGTDEILLDDATRIAEIAQEVEVDVTLSVWDEMFHVFQMIPFLPETKQALTQITAFVFKNTALERKNIGIDE
jgi:acetyl esterase/lipase